MKRTKKALLAISMVVIALLAVLGLALYSAGSLDANAAGAVLLGKAGESLRLNLSADEIDFGLVRGLELEGFRARGRLEAGRLDLAAERLVLKPRLLPLLSGNVVITQATLEGPEIRLTRRDQRPDGSAAAGAPTDREDRRDTKKRRRKKTAAEPKTSDPEPGARSTGGGTFELQVDGLSIRDAELELVSPGSDRPTLRFAGLDVDLQSLDPASSSERPILDASVRGTFSAAEISVPDLAGTDASGRLELAGGVLRLTELAMLHELGPLEAEEIEVDLAREPFAYELQLGGGPLDTGLMLGAGPGGGMGASSLVFTGRGLGPEVAGLVGEGSLEIAGGTLPELPILVDVDRLLVSTELVGSPHEPTSLLFRLDGGRMEVAPCRFESRGVRLDLEGWVERGGELALDLVVSAPRGKIEIAALSQTVLDKLTDAEGRTSLAFRIRGTRERPRVAPDVPALTRSERERLEDELKDALKDKLRELFGKDGDD